MSIGKQSCYESPDQGKIFGSGMTSFRVFFFFLHPRFTCMMHVCADHPEEMAKAATDVNTHRRADTKCASSLTLRLHLCCRTKISLLVLLNASSLLCPSLPLVTFCSRHVCRTTSKGSLQAPTDSCLWWRLNAGEGSLSKSSAVKVRSLMLDQALVSLQGWNMVTFKYVNFPPTHTHTRKTR